MKKFFSLICISISVLTVLISPATKISAADSLGFARVTQSNTLLYRSPEASDNFNNVWCVIRETYFVEVLLDIDVTFYKVNYNGIIGYLKKNKVAIVNGAPANPYPKNITFDITDESSRYLRSSPSITSGNNTIATLSKGSKNLPFIGEIVGAEVMDFSGNVWYLTIYEGHLGYVYKNYTENLTFIPQNTEQLSTASTSVSQLLNPLTNSTCVIVIVSILIPCLFIIFLMFHPREQLPQLRKGKYKDKLSLSSYDEYNDKEL